MKRDMKALAESLLATGRKSTSFTELHETLIEMLEKETSDLNKDDKLELTKELTKLVFGKDLTVEEIEKRMSEQIKEILEDSVGVSYKEFKDFCESKERCVMVKERNECALLTPNYEVDLEKTIDLIEGYRKNYREHLSRIDMISDDCIVLVYRGYRDILIGLLGMSRDEIKEIFNGLKVELGL